MPPKKHAFNPHLFSQSKTAKVSFLQSQHIWIGCGPTDCAGFVLHEGTLTVCSGGRYLNLGDVHMGGKGGKWNGIYARFSARWKANKPKATCDTNISWCIVFSFCHSSSVQTSHFLSSQQCFRSTSLSSCWQYSCTIILTFTSVSTDMHNTVLKWASVP